MSELGLRKEEVGQISAVQLPEANFCEPDTQLTAATGFLAACA